MIGRHFFDTPVFRNLSLPKSSDNKKCALYYSNIVHSIPRAKCDVSSKANNIKQQYVNFQT